MDCLKLSQEGQISLGRSKGLATSPLPRLKPRVSGTAPAMRFKGKRKGHYSHQDIQRCANEDRDWGIGLCNQSHQLADTQEVRRRMRISCGKMWTYVGNSGDDRAQNTHDAVESNGNAIPSASMSAREDFGGILLMFSKGANC